ncbi:MAG: IclR family transcriptional regulator [Alphaproteobacteria bacterium]|nr:IclR family transcriptional regulator [Alphaproteobacteria bacterium]
MKKAVKKQTYSAPALEKGLDIIELLSNQETGMSQSEIARALGRSVGEIFRMLVVLMERGYVALEPLSDRYVLTTYLFEISHRIPKIRRLTAFAGPLMRAMVKTINQSSHLAILNDDSILVVGQVDSPGNNTMAVRLGAKIDLWSASSGRVILAHIPEEEVDSYFANVPLPPGMNEEAVRKDLQLIREKGHEVRDSFVVRGVVNVSVPVIDHSGRAVAALTIPHIEKYRDPVTFEDCRKELIATARELTRSLGGGTIET